MIVFGRNCFVFESTGRTCQVQPFDSSLGIASNVPIVDAAIAYDCPFTGDTVILIARNALHIPSMNHNLVPPFIMRAGGVTVNDTPKIHRSDPTVDDHCIIFPSTGFRIPLQLIGTFSFFHSRTPTTEELYNCDKYFISPDSEDWNPHCLSFERNERAMTNYEGEMNDRSRWSDYQMEPASDQSDLWYDMSGLTISSLESHLDNVASSALTSCDPNVNDSDTSLDADFAAALQARGDVSKFGCTIGSCTVTPSSHEDFFDQPTIMDLETLEQQVSSMVTPEDIASVKASIASYKASRAKGVTPETLSKLWNISLPLASDAIEKNTQLKRYNAENSLSRNFSTNDRMLRYRRIQSCFYTDTMFSLKVKSTRGNKCCQVFVSDRSFVAVYPMKSQEEFEQALHWFCKQVGVPRDLICDSHKSQKSNSVKRFCDQVGTTLKVLERGTPWANRAELYIGLLKEAVRKDLRESNAPMCLWDYALERRAQIHNLIPRPLFQNNGNTPFTATFGEQGDISKLCTFGWYEFVYYRDHGSFPENKEKLGRVLGPLLNEGNEMAQAILTSKGTIVPRRSMRKLTHGELHSDSEKKKRNLFDSIIVKKLGDSMHRPESSSFPEWTPYEDDDNFSSLHIPDDQDPVDEKGSTAFEKPITDRWINAELNLPLGETMEYAKVIGRTHDDNGNVIGTYDDNPILNSMTYDVEFKNGEIREFSANVIAENMFAQVDANGHSHNMLDAIIDYDKDESLAVPMNEKFIVTKSGTRRRRQSTVGWKLLVLWKNGKEEWMPLSILKETLPLEVAEFAVSRGIDTEPAFEYWVPFTLRKRDRIIAGVKSRVKSESHKFGIKIPRTIQEAYALDAANGNTLWRDAINKEMENLKVAFDILEPNKPLPKGYTHASGHLVFDVRMTLERKARWVKDGHRTPEPSWSTYAGVVSRESVRILLTYAALNDVPVWGCDIQNAYLQAPASEKHYIICGPEFGLENVGKRALIIRALYGGKSAGADYWRHVRYAMEEMNFQPCKADSDVWMRPGIRPDGKEYWQYALLYVDDILVIMDNPEEFLREELGRRFTIKEKSIGPPSQYLGNKVLEVDLSNGTRCWAFGLSQYVQNAVNNVDDYLQKKGEKPLHRCKSPWPSNYRPEIDTTPELTPHDASYFQSLIGIMRWIVELGRADLVMETSALASMMALPREGHLKALLQIFAFLKNKHNSLMVFDPTVPDIDESQFTLEDWAASEYGEQKEDLPPNMPTPRGIGFTMRAFVDSDHAGDSITRRSRTGFIVTLNSSPIYWFSKKQTSVETSSFGSEFIAMKQCCEYVRGLRYKLRMLGIPVELPTYVFGDNQSVLTNSSKPHSKLKKKSSSIAYHFVREGVAKDEWRLAYLNTHLNPADMCTKYLPSGEKRTRFTSYLLHYVN